jgi:hypothetical protein
MWTRSAIVLLKHRSVLAWSISLLCWLSLVLITLQPGLRMLTLFWQAQNGDRTVDLDGTGIVFFCSVLSAVGALLELGALALLPLFGSTPAINTQPIVPANRRPPRLSET